MSPSAKPSTMQSIVNCYAVKFSRHAVAHVFQRPETLREDCRITAFQDGDISNPAGRIRGGLGRNAAVSVRKMASRPKSPCGTPVALPCIGRRCVRCSNPWVSRRGPDPGSWETVERNMHANPTLFGWGSLDPMELYHHYSSQAAGVEYYNPGYYKNIRQSISISSKHWMRRPGNRRCRSGSKWSGTARLALASKATRPGPGW